MTMTRPEDVAAAAEEVLVDARYVVEVEDEVVPAAEAVADSLEPTTLLVEMAILHLEHMEPTPMTQTNRPSSC